MFCLALVLPIPFRFFARDRFALKRKTRENDESNSMINYMEYWQWFLVPLNLVAMSILDVVN